MWNTYRHIIWVYGIRICICFNHSIPYYDYSYVHMHIHKQYTVYACIYCILHVFYLHQSNKSLKIILLAMFLIVSTWLPARLSKNPSTGTKNPQPSAPPLWVLGVLGVPCTERPHWPPIMKKSEHFEVVGIGVCICTLYWHPKWGGRN